TFFEICVYKSYKFFFFKYSLLFLTRKFLANDVQTHITRMGKTIVSNLRSSNFTIVIPTLAMVVEYKINSPNSTIQDCHIAPNIFLFIFLLLIFLRTALSLLISCMKNKNGDINFFIILICLPSYI